MSLALHTDAAALSNRIYIPVQFAVVNGDFNDAMIYLRREGETVASFRGQKNLKLRLDYNSEYTIDFTKPGYITKSIRVNTVVEEERKKYGFDPYKIGVRLFKQYEGVNIVIYNQPVASIRFLPEMDDFGYDTDYTKSILSALSRTEEILEQKAREEIEELKAAVAREKEQKKTLKMTVSLPEKNEIKNAPEVDHQTAAEVPKSQDRITVNELEKAPVGEGAHDKSGVISSPVMQGEDPIKGADNFGGDDRLLKGEGDNGLETHTVNVAGVAAADVKPEQHLPAPVYERDVQEIVEPNRTITVFRIKEGEQIKEFRNINYKWGGMFYFMNDSKPISEHLFKFMTTQPLSR